jgi:pimeloyl-ACP methyl ester carboxylesterase
MKALRMLLSLTLVAGLVLGGIALFQDRLRYFPAPASLAQLETARLRAWPAADDFRGLLAQPAAPEPARATALVFHGNAGHAGHRAHYVDALGRQGVRTILAEYPGYGPRDGALGEAALVDDASRTLEAAHRQFGAPLLVIGESLGAGVAAAAVARHETWVAGLMLITPWDRLENVASHHYPWLPVSALLRDRYDSAANLAGFRRPVLVVVAQRDTIVPAVFGRALHDGLGAPKRLVELVGSGHNDWPTRVDARWWDEAMNFLLSP